MMEKINTLAIDNTVCAHISYIYTCIHISYIIRVIHFASSIITSDAKGHDQMKKFLILTIHDCIQSLSHFRDIIIKGRDMRVPKFRFIAGFFRYK